MGAKDPRVDTYIQDAAPFARPILRYLRKAVHAGCPEVTETLKWRMPSFEYKGILAGMAAFKAHCVFGFWKGQLLSGARKPSKAEGPAMGDFGRITSVSELPSQAKLVALVRQAAKLNDAGVKRVPKSGAKGAAAKGSAAKARPPRMPADFAQALKKNKTALAAFEAFSPGHKREYIEWIVEAKKPETRDRRLAVTVEWLLEGKVRNWKYEPK